MPQKHYIEVTVNEEAYAAASGIYGMAGAFVVRAGQMAANKLGLDWECTNQIHVQFTLSGGTEQQYAQFEKALQERLEIVKPWVEFRPKCAPQISSNEDQETQMQSNQPTPTPATKLIEVRLRALTSLDYCEVVEVPADFTPHEIDQLVERRYDDVDGGAYSDDPDYWERGTCYATAPDMPDAIATVKVSREGGALNIEEVLEDDNVAISVESGAQVVAPAELPPAEDESAEMLVSLDGGMTFVPVTDGVRIIYKNVAVPGEDEPGELHLNATSEGLISDLWVSRDEHLDHNLGTSAQMVDDLVERLVDDPVDEDDGPPRQGM